MTTLAPPASGTSAPVQELVAACREARLLGSTAAILGWDQETMMPDGGLHHRARQLAQLAKLEHQLSTDPRIGDLLKKAEEAVAALPATHPDRVNVRELRRDYDKATKLPAALVEELASVSSVAQHEWAEARKASDFARFRPWLEKIVHLNQQKADCFGWDRASGERWDALADSFEPGCTAAQVSAVFEPLRTRLQGLLDRLRGATRKPDGSFNDFELDVAAQEKLARFVCERIGFDFSRGRLDKSTHPFCGGSHCNDVRMTCRYAPRTLLDGMGSAMHESGHGMYEQGLDPAWISTPMGEAVSLSVHESQSRLWENQVGRSLAFWKWCTPQLPQFFGDRVKAFSAEQIYQAANLVEPGYIRVDADEGTYNMHIMVRFALERALISGRLPVKDLPGEWNRLYKEYLGLAVPDDRRGCLQDVHWAGGMIGYFPTYTLGTLYAAQYFEAAKAELPGLEEGFARGEFLPLRQWLNRKIHATGRTYLSNELCTVVTGKPLSADPLMRHLESKLLPMYGL
ncbi:MAG: carboxypeptidase M32 [Phycisphaerales bacterium]